MAKSHEITRAANSLKLSADKIVMLPVSEVRPYEKNPRKNADAVKFVKASIEQFGFKVPIIVDSNRVVVCGHTRLMAAKSLGMSEVPCIMADDLTEDQIRAFRLADNKVGEFAEWDMDLLGDELDAIAEACDIDMGDFGFDDKIDDEEENGTEEKGVNLSETFQIIVECENEIEQQEIFEKLSGEGYKCRLSTL
jgi:ParB-like chromosome segregation protein Spo0J